jgi:hypothetical protein
VSQTALTDCTALVGKDYQAIGGIAPGATMESVVVLRIGHPASARNLRGLTSHNASAYGGRYFNANSSSERASEAPTSDNAPFDQNGASLQDALVNWQTFDPNSLTQEARTTLIMSALGAESAPAGLSVACWRTKPRASDRELAIDNAYEVDQHLTLWRVPVEPHQPAINDELGPTYFTWDILDSTSSAAFDDEGLTLQPGDHLLALTPWIDTRLSSQQVTLTFIADLRSGLSSGGWEADVDCFDWEKGEFVALSTVNGGAITARDTQTGALIAPNGEIRLRFRVRQDAMTLFSLVPTVKIE